MMQHQLIDSNGGKPISYDSLLVKPAKLSIFGSDLCLKIVQELVKEPCCAMDLARRLEQHEQKIYYHLRRLEDAGIVKQVRAERRYSMTAKIYGVVAPVVSTKLYDGGKPAQKGTGASPAVRKFFEPFIIDGRLNAKIIMGDP
ncbi:MAG: ArsR/SmtB family transcription factor, partial [Candidatus Aenigmatarchaeota archaeon]